MVQIAFGVFTASSDPPHMPPRCVNSFFVVPDEWMRTIVFSDLSHAFCLRSVFIIFPTDRKSMDILSTLSLLKDLAIFQCMVLDDRISRLVAFFDKFAICRKKTMGADFIGAVREAQGRLPHEEIHRGFIRRIFALIYGMLQAVELCGALSLANCVKEEKTVVLARLAPHLRFLNFL